MLVDDGRGVDAGFFVGCTAAVKAEDGAGVEGISVGVLNPYVTITGICDVIGSGREDG